MSTIYSCNVSLKPIKYPAKNHFEETHLNGINHLIIIVFTKNVN